MSFVALFRKEDSVDTKEKTTTSTNVTGLFSSNRAASPLTVDMGNGNKGKSPTNNESESSPFHATSTTIRLSESLRSGISGLGGFLRLRDNITITDPKLIAARQMVEDALTAERLADKALMEARNKVREAKEHVRNLEQEAHEEAMRAKARHAEAKMVSKSAKGLGKYG